MMMMMLMICFTFGERSIDSTPSFLQILAKYTKLDKILNSAAAGCMEREDRRKEGRKVVLLPPFRWGPQG